MPSTRSGCSEPHRIQFCTLPGRGHPQLLWVTCSVPHHPHSNPTEKRILADLLLPKLPSTGSNSLYQCFCMCLQLPDKIYKSIKHIYTSKFFSVPDGRKKAKSPRASTCLCDQDQVRYDSKAKKKTPQNIQQLVSTTSSTTNSTVCHEVSYNLTFSQLPVLYYSLYTQVSLA